MSMINMNRKPMDERLNDEKFYNFFIDYWQEELDKQTEEQMKKGYYVIDETLSISTFMSDKKYVDKVYAIYKTKEA